MDEGRTIGGHGTPEEWLEHAGWVRALARALVRDAATADDVVQETWLAAMRRAPRASGPLRPWLARIVRNVATDRARAETRRTDREARVEHEPRHERAPDEVAESIETQKFLLAAVERLQDPLRSAVVRRYFHGKTSIEIAREDGVAESTVRERIERGLQALRRDLDAHHRGDRGAWMAVLAPIARRADTQVASSAAAAAGIGVAMGITWKVGAAALVVVALFVGISTWTRAPIATDPLAARTNQDGLDAVDSGDIAEARVAGSRRSVAGADTEQTPSTASPAPTVDRVAWLEARIVDRSGSPIAGARLACIDGVDNGKVERKDAPSATSSSDGRVRLELHQRDSDRGGSLADWSDSIWSVHAEASAPAFAPHTLYVDVAEGRTSACGSITLVAGGSIVGRVTDEAGRGLADAQVRLVPPDMTLEDRDLLPWNGLGNDVVAQTKTGADGSYRFDGISIGVYCVWSRKSGLECAFDDRVRVAAGGITNLRDLRMVENVHAITGIVVDQDGSPVPTMMRFVPSGQRRGVRWDETSAGPDGRFVLDVAPGSLTDIYFDRSGVKVPAWCLLERVAAGSHDLVVALKPMPMIDLAVQDEKGVSVAQWNLNQHEPTGGGSSWQNMRHEHWRIPAGGMPFTLEIEATGFQSKTIGPYDAKTAPTSMVVTLNRAGTIHGRITGAGRPVGHARIRVCSQLAPGARTGNGFPLRLDWTEGGAETGPDGTFELTLQDKSQRTIIVQPWDQEGEDEPDGFARAELAWPLAASPDALDVQLRRGGRLEGHVSGFSLGTSSHTFVSVSCGDGIVRSTRIQNDGAYAFDHMAAGVWLVRPTKRNYIDNMSFSTGPPEPGSVSVTIAEGQTSRLDLAIPEIDGAALDGVLRWPRDGADTWTARFDFTDHVNDWDAVASVGPDGGFHFEMQHGGSYHLLLRAAASATAESSFTCDLDLAPGPNHWELAPVLGSLAETNAPVRDLELTCRLAAGVTWTARWRPTETGRNVLDDVPAGHLVIRGEGRILAEVDVVAGEAANVRWN